MTGFGRGQAGFGDGRVVVELRTLNHRYQDLRVHLPQELSEHEEEVDKQLRASFPRGRIELTARLYGSRAVQVRLDKTLAKSCLDELESLREELGLSEPVSLNILSSISEIFIQEPAGNREGIREALLEALSSAIEAAQEMRSREAESLAQDLMKRVGRLLTMAESLEELSRKTAPAVLAKLQARLDRLLEGESRKLDETRLAQEVALIADRSDICEELTRLRSHVSQLGKIAEEAGCIGRRLDFLLQEMNREISTIGAKSQDAEIQHIVVDYKGELTRIREQVQNIE